MTPLSEGSSVTLLLYALTVGAALGVLWDVFRVIRIAAYGRRVRPKRLFIRLPAEENEVKKLFRVNAPQKSSVLSFICVFISDIAFCIFSALCVILLIFRLNNGNFRGFALLGAIVGFTVYYFTVGKLTVIFSDMIIRAVKRVIRFILSLTVLPIVRLFRHIYKAIAERIALKRRRRLTESYVAAALKNAESLFGIQKSISSARAVSLRKKGRYKRL